MHPAKLPVEVLTGDCDFRTLRRSGPGGQHRNKVETAVVAKHRSTGISAEANERRSQADNRTVALFRLRLALAMEVRSSDDQESPSQLWESRKVKGKLSVSGSHDDFPSILAELLDQLSRCEYSLPQCAAHFGVTSSQLIKILRSHSPALTQVNQSRLGSGLHRLT